MPKRESEFDSDRPGRVRGKLSRRDFLKATGVIAGSAFLAACTPDFGISQSSTATAVPTATLLPTSTPTIVPTPTEIVRTTINMKIGYREPSAPERYSFTYDIDKLSPPIQITVETDESLVHPTGRYADKPLKAAFNIYMCDKGNDKHIDYYNPDPEAKFAKQQLAEGVSRALWHAWQDNDPDKKTGRKNIPFERYMDMVNAYKSGTDYRGKPVAFDDIKVRIYAYDVESDEAKYFDFDPAGKMAITFTDKRDHMTTWDLANAGDDYARGAHRLADGSLRILVHFSRELVGGIRRSDMLTAYTADSLNSLTFPVRYQILGSVNMPGSEYFPDKYHPDVLMAMRKTDRDSGYDIGVIRATKETGDNGGV